MPRQAETKVVLIGDLRITVYSLRHLAERLHRSPSTIRGWEFQKIFPKPLVTTKDGRRWYMKEEIDLYVRLAEEEQIKNGKSFDGTKFTARAFGERGILEKKLAEEIDKCHGKS